MKTLHKPTERVLLILETLANADGMTLSELSLKTDISKGTIFPSSNRCSTGNISATTIVTAYIRWGFRARFWPAQRWKKVLAENDQ